MWNGHGSEFRQKRRRLHVGIDQASANPLSLLSSQYEGARAYVSVVNSFRICLPSF